MATRAAFRPSGIFQLVLVLCVLLSCGRSTLPAPPDEILGTWRTSARGYERSFLTIEPTKLTIGMGKFSLFEYPIERVDYSVSSSGQDTYELHYESVEGYEDSIVVRVQRGAETFLTMDHPTEPWRRDR